MSKKSVAVRIAGHEYKIRSDSDEESLRQIALYVDQAMTRVRNGTGTVDSLDVAVLTCLNLGREILALKNRKTAGASDASLRSLIEEVEAAIPAVIEEAALEEGAADQRMESSSEEVATSPTTQKPNTTAPTPAAPSTPATASVKALELPKADGLRGRNVAEGSSDSGHSDDVLPEARMAAGGRDRAS